MYIHSMDVGTYVHIHTYIWRYDEFKNYSQVGLRFVEGRKAGLELV